jgi:hypothetical protein
MVPTLCALGACLWLGCGGEIGADGEANGDVRVGDRGAGARTAGPDGVGDDGQADPSGAAAGPSNGGSGSAGDPGGGDGDGDGDGDSPVGDGDTSAGDGDTSAGDGDTSAGDGDGGGGNASLEDRVWVLFAEGGCSAPNQIEVRVDRAVFSTFQFVTADDCLQMTPTEAGQLEVRCVDPDGVLLPSAWVGPAAASSAQTLDDCAMLLNP